MSFQNQTHHFPITLAQGILNRVYGNNTIQPNFLICDSLEVLAAVATPWQQKPPIVTHAGIVGPNVTMAFAQPQKGQRARSSFRHEKQDEGDFLLP